MSDSLDLLDQEPWTADEMIRAVEAALKPKVEAMKGTLDVASDPEHAFQLLANSPAGWRVLLGWPGFGDHPEAALGVTTQRLYVVVQIGKGMSVDPGAVLHHGRPSLPGPMAQLIELVTGWVRALRFPDGSGYDTKGFAQGSSAWLDLEDADTKQHQIEFSIPAALPSFGETIELSPSQP